MVFYYNVLSKEFYDMTLDLVSSLEVIRGAKAQDRRVPGIAHFYRTEDMGMNDGTRLSERNSKKSDANI